jgi:hypothetical protein
MVDADINGDGMVEYIHSFGGRSFSVRDQYGNQIFDSGDEFEQITYMEIPECFNCNYDDEEFVFEYKARSDDKGPEPEGMTMGYIGNDRYAFIGLERTGGIMMYKVNDPKAPQFIDYINTADVENGSGDISPEGLEFISGDDHPSGDNILVVGHEVSGTVAVYKVFTPTGFSESIADNRSTLSIYPNPTNRDVVYLNKVSDVSIFSINGQLIKSLDGVKEVNIAEFDTGMYIFRDTEGNVQKLVITE